MRSRSGVGSVRTPRGATDDRALDGAGRLRRRSLLTTTTASSGFEPADIAPKRSFTGDLGIDSLTMTEVVVAAEDRFGVLIPDDDWARSTTVGDALRYSEQSTAAPP